MKDDGSIRTMDDVNAMREAVGIECANCSTCAHLSTDCNGADPPGDVSWEICIRFEDKESDEKFPYDDPMICWEPHFWMSKFIDDLDGTDDATDKAFKCFMDAVTAVETKISAEKKSE